MNEWVTAVSGPLGALATLALFLWGFRAGWWSTALEVQAWKDRATRAEHQVDTILPALEKVGGIVTRTSEAQAENARVQALLLSFMEDLQRGTRDHPRKGSAGS